MKIVSWNCNGALRAKHALIDQLNADIVVIQECEDPSQSTNAFRKWAGNYLWHGESKHKGIGIFSRSGCSISRLDWNDDGLQLFLPCRVNDQFSLLAVWTKYANSPNFRYIGQMWKYLQLHKTRMLNQHFLLCGDLNSNKCWDEWDRWWNHSDVVREFEEIGVFSMYHQYFNELQGAETRPTLYHYRNVEKPYHVDYMFASKDLFASYQFDVGKRDDWLKYSDHMPLILQSNR
jgi:exonuclease III